MTPEISTQTKTLGCKEINERKKRRSRAENKETIGYHMYKLSPLKKVLWKVVVYG